MSTTVEEALANALAEVPLESEKTFFCKVRGRKVKVRVEVVDRLPPAGPVEIEDPGPMLTSWVDLPLPEPTFRGVARLTEPPLPDVPEIPHDEEELP
jgi:hypothetical protein